MKPRQISAKELSEAGQNLHRKSLVFWHSLCNAKEFIRDKDMQSAAGQRRSGHPEVCRELFFEEGFHFVVANDGPAMRRALDSDPDIDVVVIDILLPCGVDGLILAEEAAGHGDSGDG